MPYSWQEHVEHGPWDEETPKQFNKRLRALCRMDIEDLRDEIAADQYSIECHKQSIANKRQAIRELKATIEDLKNPESK